MKWRKFDGLLFGRFPRDNLGVCLRHICYNGYRDAASAKGIGFCTACSNGNAADNTIEEAILQGALELVERDSVAK